MSAWAPGPEGPPTPEGIEVGGARYPSGPPADWPAWAPPRPGSAPTPAPEPPAPERRPAVVGAIAVVVVLALAAVAVAVWVGSGSDDDVAATETTVDLSDPEITAPPSEEPIEPFGPSMPSFPELPELDPGGPLDPDVFAEPLDEVLPDLIAFVEETRGQEFVTDPVVTPLPEAEFVERVVASQAEEADALAAATVTDAALGLIPEDADLTEVAGDAAALGVLGFYDPETSELVVRGSMITPFVQMVIVHELTHALDDQIFDLSGLEALAERGDESAFGYLALVEGTASFVGDAFREQLTPDEASALSLEELQLGFEQMAGLIDIPAAFAVASQVPYASGQRFVEALLDEGGTAAIDAAYAEPPTTSEQILDPAVYRAGEGAVPLQALASQGEVAEERAFGAADLRLLEVAADPTSALLDPAIGELEPVPGFGGGRLVSWTDAGERCARVEVVGDDATGNATIQAVLDGWADSVGDVALGSRPGGTGIPVLTAERCV